MRHVTASFLVLFLGSMASGCAAGMAEVRLDAAERSRLTGAPVVHSVHYDPFPRLRVIHLGGLVDAGGWMALEDPVASVEAGFLEGLQRETGLSNVRRFDRPLPSGHSPARGADPADLRGVFHEGLVLDFESYAWQMPFVSRSFTDSARTTYGIDYALRARLVRLPDGLVLWQAFCNFTRDEAPRPLGELEANGSALLLARRDELARTCSKELVGSFMGRLARSSWSGKNEPVSK